MAHGLIKPVKSLFGVLVAAGVLGAMLWFFVGGPLKIFGPHLFGYEHVGWRHAGARTIRTITVPKWLGADTLLSAAVSPFRQHKVYMEKGDRLIIAYDASVERGGLILSVYRTNFSLFLQGPLVEDHQAWRLDHGKHRGVFEYTAPQNGFYEFDNEVRWEYGQRAPLPLPDFDVEYEYAWRIEHAAKTPLSRPMTNTLSR